jgi:hypothetical protein
VIAACLFLAQNGRVQGQQVADPAFDPKVAIAAYTANHPKVLFDEAHLNFHTAGGRYKPFVSLITNDGYRVTPNTQRFQKSTLAGYDILVIANARGPAGGGAFTAAECDAVLEWVTEGGSLLLIADHSPYGEAADYLASLFGVAMSRGSTTDPQNYFKESGNQGFIVFTRDSGRLSDHPILNGRNSGERINRLMTFTGQSLKAPPSGAALMKLADTAIDAFAGGGTAPPGASATGRAQGVAIQAGRGRVVVLGEAGMLSAQVVRRQNLPDMQMGMNVAGTDNRQFALNVMHWLSRLI